MIRANNISKSFARPLFNDLSFEISNGITQICGKSGSGKSTLMNILMNNEKFDKGEVTYSKKNYQISYCGQEPSLLNDFSLIKNIEIFRLDIDFEIYEKLKKILNFPYEKSKLIDLSIGERQKAEIIACMSKRADTYFMDEPFSSIDKECRDHLIDFLNEFSINHEVVIINHNISCSKLVIKQNIELVNTDLNSKLINNPKFKEDKIVFRRNFKITFFSWLRSQKLNNIVHFVISAACFIMLALGSAYLNFDSVETTTKKALSSDPFTMHPIKINTLYKDVTNNYYEDLLNYSYLGFTLVDKNTFEKIDFYANLPDDSQEVFYFSNADKNLISSEQEIDVSGNKYNLKIIDSNKLKGLITKPSLKLQELLDGLIETRMIFCSPIFARQLICSSDSPLFSVDNLKLFALPGLSYDASKNYLMFGKNYKEDIVIVDSNDKILSIPNVKEGEFVYDSDYDKYYVDSTLDDSKIHVSYANYLFMNLKIDRYSPSIYLDISNEDLVKMMEKYNGISCSEIIVKPNLNNQFLYYFIPAVFLLLGEVFYSIYSKKGFMRYYKSLNKIYKNNQLDDSCIDKTLIGSQSLIYLSGILISTLLYIFLFIPLVNNKLMTIVYGEAYNNLSPYSMQPSNPYYDHVNYPLQFNHFEYIYLIIIAFFSIMLIGFFLAIKLSKKEKRK